jgi:hypothetical protein
MYKRRAGNKKLTHKAKFFHLAKEKQTEACVSS